jgi:hypothetical protein
MPPADRDASPLARRPHRLLWAGAAVALVLAGAAGVLVGRGGSAAPARPVGSPVRSLAADAGRPPTEGPATAPHTWPDGITARIVEVTRADANQLPLGPESPANDAGVIVTTEIANTGSGELRWDTSTAVPDGTLFYGRHRLPAHMYGWANGPPLPTRLLPGGSVRWSVIGFLPGTQLGSLAYSMTPLWNDPTRPEWTFTGVDRLLTSKPSRRVAPGPPSTLSAAGR